MATLALLLVTPLGDELFVSAAVLVGLVVATVLAALRRLPAEAIPWLAVPPLSALTLWSFSAPNAYVFAAVGAVVGWCLVGLVLLVRLLSRAPATRSEYVVWGGSIVIGLLLLIAARTEAPLALRFELSEDAMNDTARAVMAGEGDPATIDRIGLWNVSDVRRVRSGMRFRVDDVGFLSGAGFAYQADGLPPPGPYAFEYYRAGWYIWRELTTL